MTDCNFALKWFKYGGVENRSSTSSSFLTFSVKNSIFAQFFETFRDFRSSRLRMTLALIKINKIPRLFVISKSTSGDGQVYLLSQTSAKGWTKFNFRNFSTWTAVEQILSHIFRCTQKCWYNKLRKNIILQYRLDTVLYRLGFAHIRVHFLSQIKMCEAYTKCCRQQLACQLTHASWLQISLTHASYCNLCILN